MKFTLYSADNCPLCDIAEEKVHTALAGKDYQLKLTNIRSSAELTKKYALRIPVLRLEAASPVELSWPFEESQVMALANTNDNLDEV